MKIEIEVTEAELKDALARHIRTAVADRVNHWGAQEEVQKKVKQAWDETVDALIKEQMANSEALKQKVQDAIEAKLKGQINALMRGKK